MGKKVNHIKFFKLLVCPDKERNDVISFQKWCDKAISEKPKYLEERTFMLLEYYTVFKRLYKYTKKNFEDDVITNITCDFDKENLNMIVNIEFDKDIDPIQSINEAKEFFMTKDTRNYDIRSLNRNLENPNILTITFYKKE